MSKNKVFNFKIGRLYIGPLTGKEHRAVNNTPCTCSARPECDGKTVFVRLNDGYREDPLCGFEGKSCKWVPVKTQQEEVFIFKVKK